MGREGLMWRRAGVAHKVPTGRASHESYNAPFIPESQSRQNRDHRRIWITTKKIIYDLSSLMIKANHRKIN